MFFVGFSNKFKGVYLLEINSFFSSLKTFELLLFFLKNIIIKEIFLFTLMKYAIQ
jgi:hypothetical protein